MVSDMAIKHWLGGCLRKIAAFASDQLIFGKNSILITQQNIAQDLCLSFGISKLFWRPRTQLR